MKSKREFIDTLSNPTQLDLALEHALDVLSQIPITVVASGRTAQGVIEGNLTGNKLTFVTHRQSLEPYPDSEPIKRLRNMTIKDEGVHYLIDDLIIGKNMLGFTIDDIPVEIELVEKGDWPSVDDPDCVSYRFDMTYIPNKTYAERTVGGGT